MDDVDFSALPVFLQQAVARGDVDLEELERRLLEADTCPRCGRTDALKRTTGLCGACHLERVTAAYRATLAERAARRELDAERQRSHRLARCPGCGRAFTPRATTADPLCLDCRREARR